MTEQKTPRPGVEAAADRRSTRPNTSRPPAVNEARGQNVRRPSDLLLSCASLGVILVVFGLIHELPIGSTEATKNLAGALHHIPRFLSLSAAVLSGLASLGLVVVAITTHIRREHQGAINAAVASLCAVAIAIVAVAIWHGEHGAIATAMLHHANPSLLVIDTAYVAFLTGADLVRRPRWTRWCIITAAAMVLADLAVGVITAFSLLVVPLAGWWIGLLTRWSFGAVSVGPTSQELVEQLATVGLHIASLDDKAGPRRDRSGTLIDGSPILVRTANRDTSGYRLVGRLWELLRLRETATGHLLLSSKSQLQQEALASYAANDSGVLVPRVRALLEISETLVLVLRQPGASPFLAEQAGYAEARSLFVALRALHDAGVAHRDLREQNLLIEGDVGGFASLERAVPGSSELVRRLDVAQLLTTLGRAVGASNAVKALRDGYRPDDEHAIAAVLQPVALAPWGWTEMMAARGCLPEVRHELVGPDTGIPNVPLERFRWRTVFTVVALTLAAFVLVGQLSKVNLLGALSHTNLWWALLAVGASALTYLAAAVNLAAFVPKRLSIWRGFAVQLSSAFVGIALPPTVGHIAVNSRYLHRQGVDEGSIAAAVALSQVVNILTTVVLLVVIGFLTGSGVSHFHLAPSADLLIAIGVIAFLLIALILVPRTRRELRHHVWPRLKGTWPRLVEAMSQPARVAVGAGGNLALTIGYVLALEASLWAVGAHPALLATTAVYLAGNTIGAAAPTPGGLGAVEAVLTVGLTATGIPAHEAVPAVLIFRAATFWLPIPAGWASFVVLQRAGTL